MLGLRLEDCHLLLYFWKLIPKRFGQDNRKYGLQKKSKKKPTKQQQQQQKKNPRKTKSIFRLLKQKVMHCL